MTQPDWSARLVRAIAGEVKRHRIARGMSAQQLADACAALGHPIPRSVLANLESGRRETISVPELVVLAQALEVPPILLLLPLGHADTVEVLPGVEVSTADAQRWLTGESPLPGTTWDDLATSTIPSFQVHRQNVERWESSRMYVRMIRDGSHPGTEQDIEDLEQQADRAIEGLRGLRRLMRVRGLTPPPLPAGMPLIEEGQST